jgi:hypothetical protein
MKADKITSHIHQSAMAPCTSKFNCIYLSDESDEQYSIALESQFRNLSDIDKKQDFIYDLITGLCDKDCFKQCFETTKDRYLCRFGLTKLLKLTHSAQKKFFHQRGQFLIATKFSVFQKFLLAWFHIALICCSFPPTSVTKHTLNELTGPIPVFSKP